MGPFDMMNDPKQMGMLMAAAQMMAQSGPSARPVGLGEILGGGMGAYMNTRNGMQAQQADEEERKQAQEYRGMQMQGMRQQQETAQQAMVRAEQVRRALSERQRPQAAPTVANQAAAPQQPAQGRDLYSELMGQAEYLNQQGYTQEAMAMAEQANKFKPKFDQTPRVANGPDGKPFSYVLDELGNKKVLDGVLPRDEMKVENLGGHVMAYNPFALQHGQTFNKSMTTGDRVSLRNADVTDNRAREFNAIQQDANNIQRGEKKRTDDMTKASQVASFDTMLGTLDRLGNHEGLPRSVGVMSALPTMPGSKSADFQAELETFQSQAFIPMVAQLKGMGALSDAEGRKLTAAVGALNPKMGEQAFRASIGRIRADMEQARQRVEGGRAQPTGKPARKSVLPGQVIDGYRFKGGDPSQQSNWEAM